MKPKKTDRIVGKIQVNKRGYGILKAEPKSIYISFNNLEGAMLNDLVEVQTFRRRRRGGLIDGRVVRILERANKEVIGVLERKGHNLVVIPSDRRLLAEIQIPPKMRGDAKENQIVVVEITRFGDDRRKTQGKVREVLGDESSPSIEIDVLVREHNLQFKFPAAALEEARGVSEQVGNNQIKQRVDFRDIFTVTIDGLDAKDFDDAVSISKDDQGNFHLKVHIADVSHYVKPNTTLDEEALKRGFSAYLADRTLPMLPEELSNGICSLNPNVDRLVVSVEMKVGSSGEVKNYRIVEGAIKSDWRLTYEEVDEHFSSGKFASDKVKQLIMTLGELTDILEAKRQKAGALDFETIEPKVILNEQGRPQDVKIRERSFATCLIEEAMILTNQVVATHMHTQKVPMIYRVHEEPDLAALLEVAEIIKEFGYPLKGIKLADHKTLQSIIAFAHKREERLLINNLLLRSMKQARYSSTLAPHFGLASKCYTHFTSPIRRYSDLLVHRLLKNVLKGDDASYISFLRGEISSMAEELSGQEREIVEAERESVDVKMCELMKDRLGEVFEGLIVSVNNFGFFVQLANSAEGLVHISNLSDDYYQFEAKHFLLRGVRTNKVFRLGKRLSVKLIRVSVGERQLDFIPV